jgi:Na+/proline symporter
MTITTITIALTALSLVGYLWVGFSPASRARNEKQYFLADQTVSANDYANISVGYALQMAALFLFAYWGFVYGIGALWTALFWGIGYLLLFLVLPKFMQYHSNANAQTLHSFIRNQFRSARSLQIAAAIATIIGLMGVMLAEVDYTVAVYRPALSVEPIFLQLFFLGLGVGYIIWNGYKAEVNTERIQVPLAYIGFLAVLLVALPQVYLHAGGRAFSTVGGGMGLSLAIMAVGKLLDVNSMRFRWLNWQASIPLCALVLLVLESIWVHRSLTPGSAMSALDQPLSTQLWAQGGLGLVSLFIANALWMPVDVATWQRVGSVSGTNDAALLALRRGTFRVMLESPASWCLGAVLGWTISAGGYVPANFPDPYSVVAAFAGQLYSGKLSPLFGGWQSLFYPVFVVSCVAVMLSTVTSILSAVSLTADRDLRSDNADNVVQVRWISFGLLVAGLVMYEGLRGMFKANLPTLLYGAYSAQLSLFVVTMLALYQRRLSARAALVSIVTGLLCALISAAVAVARPDQTDLAVLPPLFAVLGSFAAYLISYQLVGRGSNAASK